MAPLTDIDEANSTIVELRGEIERLREQLRLMRQRMFGRRRDGRAHAGHSANTTRG